MAQVTPYPTAQGKRYRVRYRTPDNRQTDKRGFKTKREAQAFAAEVEVSKMRGEYVAPSLGRVTVDEMSSDWLARKQQGSAPSHYRMLESAWRVHVQPRWGTVAVCDVDVLGIEEWISTMGWGGAGATTILRAHGVLSGILGDAVKARRLAVNPSKGTVENLPRKTTKRHVYLTADDVARLADASGEHRALVLVLAYCGLRWGEAIALRVADVEFLRRRLSVHENAVQIGTRHAVGPTKGRVARSVPVPGFVLDELSVQCASKGVGDLVFGDGKHYLPRPKSSNGWFKRAVEAAGVQAITPHSLRHSAVSLAVSAGASVLALQRMLGHTSAQMTLDCYADLFDSDLDAVAEALDAARARVEVL